MPTHVIIGGGPAATNAVETIRRLDQGASRITLISDEPAHSRMAMPYWLANKIERDATLTGDAASFQALGVETRFGRRVAAIDAAGKSVTLDDGNRIAFDQLLIATGSSPIIPSIPGADLPGVQPMWTLDHARRAIDLLAKIQEPRVVLIGAGFIGFIILNALRKRGCRLTVIERESHILPRMLDDRAARLATSWVTSEGVTVRTGESVSGIQAEPDGTKQVVLASGASCPADLVVLAVGVRANFDLAKEAGIATDQGILVDDHLRTGAAGIHAAGDAAQGPVLFSSERRVHAIHPTAVDHGRVAGANMAGQDVRYPGSLAMNVVDLHGLQMMSFGEWNDAAAETMVIDNAAGHVYRKLLWTGDRITGAILVGKAADLGMLNDVGMIKGIMQTQAELGPWKGYLSENPFDIRRAFIGAGVPQRLVQTTLLGSPSRPRAYRPAGAEPASAVGPAHAVYVGTRPS
ncbi:MAG: NAD(P)/FAD-dependent oxidoreductase [Planctomycetes bacterium]|nr:NAD(P)/FAD-dependent oxidoreductase [Planctomycetota bacterium]